ncbi:urease accessory protein UreD [Bradyrhizobium sp. CB1650]|uniref:urease accessory protein UreD n=1 Tax=Bradyrhizobium sp. CB1650 TaxID=3039153 RepID=UPI0024358C52|nr:urease accessory protein UreD [Bradyrhizobium sp. CB1650]WGD50342.1 urease accessory protein UreD [Bradyrhizobium sp. CB1650]
MSDIDLERANGAGRIVVTGSASGTRISEVYQKFPIGLMFPRIESDLMKEAVIVNSSGGIAGGDRLEIEVVALNDASVAVTTQAAEKVYRALDRPARVGTKLRACGTAKLAWLPQETIVFNQARICRQTEIDLCSGAELIALEWLVLGRAARGEEVVSGHISDSWRIKKDGHLIWADGFRVSDEVFAQLHRKALLSNWKAVATLIYFGPSLDTRLEILRKIAASLDCRCAATIVGAIIVVRVAAAVSSDLRRGLRSLLEQFSRELGPGPFGVPKMWSC